MGSPLALSHGRVFGKRKSALQIQDLRRRYQQASDQLEHFLGYEPESSEVIPYLVKLLLNEGKVSGDPETVGSEIAKALHIDYESGVGMVATRRLAAPRYQAGDRVRLATFDFYSGLPEGATGTVALIYGFHGTSPYPDPAKRLLFVTWDKYGQVSVPVKSVERVRGVSARHADNYRKWLDTPTDLLIPEDDTPPTPQEWQPYEGGEDGPSQESKRGSLVHLRVHRLA